MTDTPAMIERLQRDGIARLRASDEELYELLDAESRRQGEVLSMVAASSSADPAVLACEGSALINVTTEGYPGARFHAGCEVVDQVELLAIERAKARFGARHANVQAHSGSSANAVVMFSLLEPGDTILGMDLDAGGHLTHGSKASVTGNYFVAKGYGLGEDGLINFEEVRELAKTHRPKLIICGASSYPRTIDFARFRGIADEVGAYLLADISHIAGLVVAGLHPSPIDHAHFTTTSTYKQLYGPRGGLVLLGKDADALSPDGKTTLRKLVQRGCFPYVQGTPNLAAIAAKACALRLLEGDVFRATMQRVVDGASVLASWLGDNAYRVVTGGTDNHMVLVNILERGMTGVVAERALEECGIIINKNRIPGDNKSATVTSGIRIGTNTVAVRGIGGEQIVRCGALMHSVLQDVVATSDRAYRLDEGRKARALEEVKSICHDFPLAGYPQLPDIERGKP